MNPWMLDNPEVQQMVGTGNAIPRAGRPADIADVVAFLASEAGRWVTGQIIDASGGCFLGPRIPAAAFHPHACGPGLHLSYSVLLCTSSQCYFVPVVKQHSVAEGVFYGQAGDGDAQGNAGGHRPGDPVRPARLRLRDHGVAAGSGLLDIAEGTIYALVIRIEQRGLVDVEKVPSEKGPPRKVYSLNAQGREYLEEFWRTWSFLTERLEQLREGGR